MSKLYTASGKEFFSDFYVTNDYTKSIFIMVYNTTEDEVFQIFGNAEETKQLTIGKNVFSGYIKLSSVMCEGDCFRIHLTK